MSEMTARGNLIDVDGIATHYHEGGTGPHLLLLHGSGPGVTAYANWRPVFPAFARVRHVVAPDIFGFGYTQIPEAAQFGVESWVGHLLTFMDSLDIDRCAVIGNSFGGALALHLAARQPDRVSQLVLMGSAGSKFSLTNGLDKVWGYTPSQDAMREILQLFVHSDCPVSEDLVVDRYRASLRPETRTAYEAMFPPPRQNAVDALALTDEQLASVTAEVLVIHGRDDVVVPPESSHLLVERLAHARLEIIPECGHWVQSEKTDQFIELVDGFLEMAPPRASDRRIASSTTDAKHSKIDSL